MKIRKETLKKMRQMRIERVKQYYDAYLWRDDVAVEEFMMRRHYEVISRRTDGENFYLLCRDYNSGEVIVAKLVYSQYVRAVKFSKNKISKEREFFVEWMKDFTRQRKRYFEKYIVRPDGEIHVKNTKY